MRNSQNDQRGGERNSVGTVGHSVKIAPKLRAWDETEYLKIFVRSIPDLPDSRVDQRSLLFKCFWDKLLHRVLFRPIVGLEPTMAELKESLTPKKKTKNYPVIAVLNEPPYWRQALEQVKLMRAGRDAPVDTVGCSELASKHPDLLPEHRRFQVLVSLMLSSQTKDEMTAHAMGCLHQHFLSAGIPFGPSQLLATLDEEILDTLIAKVGFHRRKSQFIRRTAQVCVDQYNGDIPRTLEGLCELPGVGPKMAHLTMQHAWNDMVGIGVDVHVQRITYRLGWTRGSVVMVDKSTTPSKSPEGSPYQRPLGMKKNLGKEPDPEQTRLLLESFLPRSEWDEINRLLVGFGQTVCKPVGPKCATCSANLYCQEGRSHLRSDPDVGSLRNICHCSYMHDPVSRTCQGFSLEFSLGYRSYRRSEARRARQGCSCEVRRGVIQIQKTAIAARAAS